MDVIDHIRSGLVEILDADGQTYGTGFFVTSDGYILTAYHVISDIQTPQIIRIKTQERLLEAEIIENLSHSERHLDFAVLKIKGEGGLNFPCLPLGTDVSIGDDWCTKGFGLSYKYRGVPNCGKLLGYADLRKDGSFRDVILKSDNPIWEGESGSPVFSIRVNKVVGIIKEEVIHTQGFAISIDTIFQLWPELEQLNIKSKSIIDVEAALSLLVLPPEEVLAERGSLPPGHRLPYLPNSVFTGREDELVEIAQALLYTCKENDLKKQASGVAVCGFGGLGKSQLAVEFCQRYGRFFNGVHWIQANLNVEAEIADCGRAMCLPHWPEKLPEQVEATLKAWQEDDWHLIVLDNAELHVVEDWLPRLYPARLLITSRKTNWPVDLSLLINNLKAFEREQSRELLRNLAPKLKKEPDEELNNIAIKLGDLPLAIDLAGRYLAERTHLSIEEYLVELEESIFALEHISLKNWAEHNPTDHSTNLAATFALSWDQLTKEDELARLLFRMGGYCAPNTPIPRELLSGALSSKKIKGWELDKALRKLDSLGLLTSDKDGRRIHTLLAEFARLKDIDAEKLDPSSGALAFLAEYYVSFFRDENNDSNKLNTHRAHVLEVQSACLEAKKWRLVRELTWAIKDYLGWQGYWKERISAVKAGLSAARIDGSRTDEGAFLTILGATYQLLGDYPEAINTFEKVLEAAGGELQIRGSAMSWMGSTYLLLCEPQRALEIFNEALAAINQVDSYKWKEGNPLSTMGLTYYYLGDFHRAIKIYNQALEVAIRTNDKGFEGTIYDNLGIAYFDLGNIHEASKQFKKALKTAHNKKVRDQRNKGAAFGDLGKIYYHIGDIKKCINLYMKQLEITRKIGDIRGEGAVLSNLGQAYHYLGENDLAIKKFEGSLNILREKKCKWEECNTLSNFAMVYLDLGQPRKAINLCEEALNIAREISYPRGKINALNSLGTIYNSLGQSENTINLCEEALNISRQIHYPLGEGNALFNISIANKNLGQKDQAIKNAENAENILKQIESPSAEKVREKIASW